jgi:hypothetical protein
MRATLLWPDAELLNGEWTKPGKDSYWIEAAADDLDAIVAHASDPDALRAAAQRDHRPEKPYSFLVATDLSSIQSFDPYYPESPQWVNGSPFVEIEPFELRDLAELPAHAGQT